MTAVSSTIHFWSTECKIKFTAMFFMDHHSGF